MFGEIFATAPSGRTGLRDIDVTPIDYLYLLHKLDSGTSLSFNKTQLQLAFKDYLRKSKGPWTHDQIRDIAGYDRLALLHVQKQQALFDKKQRSITGKSPSAEAKEKRALLEKLGLIAPEESDLPKTLRGPSKTTAQKDEAAIRKLSSGANIIQSIAMIGEPTTTVALSLILMAAESKLTNAICDMLLDTYDKKAKNHPEKQIIVDVLHNVTGQAERLQLKDKVDRLQRNETSLSHARELNALKPEAAEKTRREKQLAFEQNGDMTDRVERDAPSREIHDDLHVEKLAPQRTPHKTKLPAHLDPFALPSLAGGPRPPGFSHDFPDETRRKHDDSA